MGNTPKRAKAPNPRITPEVISAAKELQIAPGTALTASEIFLLHRMGELDKRRQEQIANQVQSINRLVALVVGVEYDERPDDAPMPGVVFRLALVTGGEPEIVVRSTEVIDDKIVITFEEE